MTNAAASPGCGVGPPCGRSVGHAHRHWNSTSYRTVAGTSWRAKFVPVHELAMYGAEGDRTPDLCSAIAALSQLSYSPLAPPDQIVRAARPIDEAAFRSV